MSKRKVFSVKGGPTSFNEASYLFKKDQILELHQTKEAAHIKLDPVVIELKANLPEGEFFDSIVGEPITEEQQTLLVEFTNQAESGEFVDVLTTTDDERPSFSPIDSLNLWLLAKSKAKGQSKQALNLELWLVRIYIDDSNLFSIKV